MIDISKAEKLPADKRYFNVSVLWIFYYRSVLRFLYLCRVPHEVVTIGSIALGLASALLFYQGKMIGGAIALHFKDILDSCDGALARLTGRGHLLGRYLDSLGDFLVLAAVVVAITAYTIETHCICWWLLAPISIVSIFLQCSVFNFYQIGYVERAGAALTSKQNESSRTDIEAQPRSMLYRGTLKALRILYFVVYSWQDKLVAAFDSFLYKQSPEINRDDWFLDKQLMTLQSPLCFGTHIFIIIVFALLQRPEWGLVFIATIMNIYLILVLYYCKRRFSHI